jgi:hypothetical protein
MFVHKRGTKDQTMMMHKECVHVFERERKKNAEKTERNARRLKAVRRPGNKDNKPEN